MSESERSASPDYLPDYLEAGLNLVLVGINPGVRSAERGHHFAGPGNRFWSLLADSGLTATKLGYERDSELLAGGIGLTNIVARVSRSSADLGPRDYAEGRSVLSRKIARYRPKAVAFVGVTVFREFWPVLSAERSPKRIACGLRIETIGNTALFVLPNPSGRNAHYSYDEMLQHWNELARWLKRADG